MLLNGKSAIEYLINQKKIINPEIWSRLINNEATSDDINYAVDNILYIFQKLTSEPGFKSLNEKEATTQNE